MGRHQVVLQLLHGLPVLQHILNQAQPFRFLLVILKYFILFVTDAAAKTAVVFVVAKFWGLY
jgi:hypothetical protein